MKKVCTVAVCLIFAFVLGCSNSSSTSSNTQPKAEKAEQTETAKIRFGTWSKEDLKKVRNKFKTDENIAFTFSYSR